MGSLPHRRGRNSSSSGEDALDLFSRRRNSIPIASSIHSDDSVRVDRLSIGSIKGRGAIDDLLDGDVGKNDYDWLLTPPGTPLFRSSSAIGDHVQAPTQRKNSNVRSVSNARASRLSAPQSDNANASRPARSNSVTRTSLSTTYSSYFTNNNRTSLLNTSSASVTSRPTTPGNHPSSSQSSTRPIPGNRPSSSQSSTRPTSSGNRPSSSQSSTRPSLSTSSARPHSRPASPAKIRPPPVEKPRPPTSSRPSTPTSRPHTPASSTPARPISRPSTPTHRAPVSRPSSPSAGRTAPQNGRNPGPVSRASSPGPRPRAPVRPTDLPDFPTDVPPNLRTKLPDRPPSAGRTRPGAALTTRSNSNSEAATSIPASLNRRQSLPIASRSKVAENPPKARVHSNTNSRVANPPGVQKLGVSEVGSRGHSKPSTVTESNGFGRTISKKSIDMALRHMDIRQSMGGIRGASLFPQSIRSASSKARPARMSEPVVPITDSEVVLENGSHNAAVSTIDDCNGAFPASGEDITAVSPEREWLTRRGEVDIYGSTRYESMLLKEDSKNMNWLHSVEDKSDESSVFDHRFEPLPEPFGLP